MRLLFTNDFLKSIDMQESAEPQALPATNETAINDNGSHMVSESSDVLDQGDSPMKDLIDKSDKNIK